MTTTHIHNSVALIIIEQLETYAVSKRKVTISIYCGEFGVVNQFLFALLYIHS